MEKIFEKYSQLHPDQVLIVEAMIDGETDQIMVFKGFSSSLVKPTAYDPDLGVLPDQAEILAISCLQAPYNPSQPIYLAQNLSWAAFLRLAQD
ncbi:MAG: hypothetical protein SFT94_09405 [Pseudanabaenaceae cyanobacterium bins.68]|nr:hypothetical protein [Pseudanabaenaceae cyanobacterium bins.68]